MAPAARSTRLLPPQGITCAQLIRICGRQPKSEEPLGFSVQARRIKYRTNDNPAPNAYDTVRPFPGRPCCTSFSEAGYGPLASRTRRLPPLRVDLDTSPADVRVEYDRFRRWEFSRGAASRVFTGPPQTGDSWGKKAWVPSPDSYSPEKCPPRLRVPPIQFQFNSCAPRDADHWRLSREACLPAPNLYEPRAAGPEPHSQGARSGFLPGVHRIVWLDEPIRRGRTLPAPNQYSRCHSESSLLGGGRSIAPESCEPAAFVTPGPGNVPSDLRQSPEQPGFNARPPAFLTSGARIGDWLASRRGQPSPAQYDVPRLYGSAELVFNWRQRLKWI